MKAGVSEECASASVCSVHMRVCVAVRMSYVCMFVCLLACIYMYVCIYLFIYAYVVQQEKKQSDVLNVF